MRIFELFLLIGLIVCATAVSFTKKLLTSIIIYMSYSSIMAIIWVILQSPDLAVTEAAVGAGVTSILFFVTLKKIRAIQAGQQEDGTGEAEGAEESKDSGETESQAVEETDGTKAKEGGQ